MKRITLLLAAALALVSALTDAALEKTGRVLARYTGTRGLVLAMANIYSQYTYDANLLLKAAALVAATADGTLELDVGTGLLCGDMVIDATAIEVDSNDESYEIILQGSTVAGFGTAAAIVALTSITVGDKASTRLAAGVLATGTDDVPGRFVVPFRNERNGTTYRYLRIKTIVAGTIATGINYSAWLAKCSD